MGLSSFTLGFDSFDSGIFSGGFSINLGGSVMTGGVLVCNGIGFLLIRGLTVGPSLFERFANVDAD
jgi:hypothetical protein